MRYHITSFDAVLQDCHGISRWFMARLSIRDRKPAQDTPSALFEMQRVVLGP